jgi:hypothetical protein
VPIRDFDLSDSWVKRFARVGGKNFFIAVVVGPRISIYSYKVTSLELGVGNKTIWELIGFKVGEVEWEFV